MSTPITASPTIHITTKSSDGYKTDINVFIGLGSGIGFVIILLLVISCYNCKGAWYIKCWWYKPKDIWGNNSQEITIRSGTTTRPDIEEGGMLHTTIQLSDAQSNHINTEETPVYNEQFEQSNNGTRIIRNIENNVSNIITNSDITTIRHTVVDPNIFNVHISSDSDSA